MHSLLEDKYLITVGVELCGVERWFSIAIPSFHHSQGQQPN